MKRVSTSPMSAGNTTATPHVIQPDIEGITWSDETHWPSTADTMATPGQSDAHSATSKEHTPMTVLRTGYTPAARTVPVHLMQPLEDGGTRSILGRLLGMQRLDGVLQHYRVRDDAGVVREVPPAWLSPGSRLAVVRSGLGMPDAAADTRDERLLKLFEDWLPLERERIAIDYRGPAAAKDPEKPDAYREPWRKLADAIGCRMTHSPGGIAEGLRPPRAGGSRPRLRSQV